MLNLETPRSIARSNLVQALALRLRVSLDDLYYALVTDAEVNPTKCNSLHAKYASGIGTTIFSALAGGILTYKVSSNFLE